MDSLDKAIVALLSKDGRMSIQKMADELGVTSPTLRSRLQSLIEAEIIRICALIDTSKIESVTTALIGMSLEKGKWEQTINTLASVEHINWIVAVTGRYDVIAQFTFPGAIQGLHKILREKLDKIKGIISTETFVIMDARNKWVFLPDELQTSWYENHIPKTKPK